MSDQPAKEKLVTALLEQQGQTFAEEIGFDPGQNTPSPLFRLLCASILFSTRISADLAVKAAKALTEEGWTTAENMVASTWEARTRALNEAGYARYDESTSRMLGETAGLCVERYGGDLRKLRDEAERDPKKERRLLKEFKGLGDVGADIFFREVQAVWDELYPFADKKTLKAAERLGLADDAETLASLVDKGEFPRLVAALVRCDLDNNYDQIEARAT